MQINLKMFLPLAVLPALVACGNVIEGYAAPPDIPAISETVVDKTFDRTWKDLHFLAADTDFQITGADRASGQISFRLDSFTVVGTVHRLRHF